MDAISSAPDWHKRQSNAMPSLDVAINALNHGRFFSMHKCCRTNGRSDASTQLKSLSLVSKKQEKWYDLTARVATAFSIFGVPTIATSLRRKQMPFCFSVTGAKGNAAAHSCRTVTFCSLMTARKKVSGLCILSLFFRKAAIPLSRKVDSSIGKYCRATASDINAILSL